MQTVNTGEKILFKIFKITKLQNSVDSIINIGIF